MSKSAAAAALAASIKENAEIRESTANSTYRQEWKRFKEFVMKQRDVGVLQPSSKYITRESVDLYCSMVVAKMTSRVNLIKLSISP